MKFALLYILISLVCIPCFAQQDSSELQIHSINSDLSYGYRKPKLFDIVTNIPKNYLDLGKGLKQKNNLAWLGFTLANTAAMIPYDQDFVEHAQNISLSANLPRKHKYINPFLGFEIPTNSSAALYHIGHGTVSFLFVGGFLATGLIKNDYRAIHTSIEITESLITLGVMTQGLKRVFGRQSPNMATQDGGEWNFFPNQKDYMKNTAYYDAMPSGHMATVIATITVISKNYPEYRWIKPIGYSMAALMGFEMMNSGVHWVSDYPLGFFIGYTVASVSVNRRITKIETLSHSHQQKKLNTNFFMSSLNGIPVYSVTATF